MHLRSILTATVAATALAFAAIPADATSANPLPTRTIPSTHAGTAVNSNDPGDDPNKTPETIGEVPWRAEKNSPTDCASLLGNPEKTRTATLCTDVTAQSAATPKKLKSSASSALIPWCPIRTTNERTRFEICLVDDSPMAFNLVKDGAIVGKASFAIRQELKFNPTNRLFDEETTFTPTRIDPSLGTFSLSWSSICGDNCDQGEYTWDNALRWTPGDFHTITGRRYRSWTGTGEDMIRVIWDVVASSTSAANNAAIERGGSQTEARCDDLVGSYPGCSVPSFTPTLVIDEAEYPAARQFIGFYAQYNDRRHLGWKGHGEPLHRQADPAVAEANRNRICPSSYVKDPDVTYPAPVIKTCDEWPFAASVESGGVTTDGNKCGQYTAAFSPPNRWGVAWDYRYSDMYINASCARATMPSDQNSGVGGLLGSFTQGMRLLDGDAYWVDAGADEGKGLRSTLNEPISICAAGVK